MTATYVKNYETVQAKQQILRIVNSSKIEMIIDIPEQLISLIPYAKDIKCKFDAFPDVEVLAKIHEIGAEASQKTRTYPVTLIMDQPEGVTILPGMAGIATGRAEIPETMNLDGYEIPETAIMEGDGDKGSVWLIDESSDPPTVERLEVTRHPSHSLTPQGVRVTGLSVGQRIATAGVHYLKEGQKVRVTE
ncbi:MAG: efflux RND transporter periplasmic adaptor subunit [Planctomycetes bacterium]|nr:efflux RND transporter periplasmic adaptor subunit [Planctomycetota bacterium]